MQKRTVFWLAFFLCAGLAISGAPGLRAAPFDELEPPAAEPTATPKKVNPPVKEKTEPDPATSPSFSVEPNWDATAEVTAAGEALLAGDVQGCEAQLRAAFVKSPNLPPPKIMLAQLLLAVNDVEGARRTLEEFALADRTHPNLYVLFGVAALRQGRVTDAGLHFEKALALAPPANWTPQQFLDHQRQCFAGQTEVAESRRDWAQQREVLGRWLEIDRTDAHLHDRLAMALFKDGRFEMAFEHFDISHRFDGKQNRPEVSMGVMAAQAGRSDESQRWFTQALARYGDDPAVHAEWSAVLLALDQAAEAKLHAAKAASLGNGSIELKYHRGVIARQLAEYAEAEKFLRQVLADSPTHADARHQLVLALIEQTSGDKRQQAAKLAQQLLQEQPRSPWTLTVAGYVLYRLGEVQLAQEKLTEALALGASWPETLYFAARVLRENGSADEAEKIAAQLERRLAIGGPFPLRAEATSWLKSTAGAP